jgi:hypothetical protein
MPSQLLWSKALQKLVFSIRTTTSKVTTEDTDKSKETENSNSKKDQVQRNKKELPSKAWGC